MCQLPHLGEKDPAPAGLPGPLWGLVDSRNGHPLAHLVVAEREVARGEVAAGLAIEQRLLHRAHLLALPAARVEAARLWRAGRSRHVAAEDLPAAREPRSRDRHGRKQRTRIGVP